MPSRWNLLSLFIAAWAVEAKVDPLTISLLQSAAASNVSTALAAFRSTFSPARPTDPIYASSLYSETTNPTATTVLSVAQKFLLTWLPGSGAQSQFESIISPLPTYVQSYLLSIANEENAIAASILNAYTAEIDQDALGLAIASVLPSSIISIALTNQAAASSEIAAEFATGTPAWFSSLPLEYQSYFNSKGSSDLNPFRPKPTLAFTMLEGAATTGPPLVPVTSLPSASSTSLFSIGVGVGLGLPICAFLAGAGILYRRRRQWRKQIESEVHGDDKMRQVNGELDGVETARLSELPAQNLHQEVAEMQG